MKDLIIKISPWIVVVVFLLLWLDSCNKIKDQTTLYNATQDTLHTERNELGQQKTSIALLTAENTDRFLKMKSNDSIILSLQALVSKYKGKLTSASLLNVSTTINTSGKTSVIPKDTIRINNTEYIYPEYLDTLRDPENKGWYSAIMNINKDSSHLQLKVRNDFELTQGLESQKGFFGFMKPKIPKASVLNLNPYTETVAYRTFTVQCECRNGRWFTLGAVSGVTGVLLLGNSLNK
jgi:hypothetical protein